jgi:DNA-binding transcriptional regulator PaaX
MQLEHDELMMGQLIAYTINFSMGRPEKPVKPYDFMPSQWAANKAKAKTKQQKRTITKKRRTAIADVFRAWAGAAPNGK